MKVKIADLDEIRSGDEALEKLQAWLDKYAKVHTDGNQNQRFLVKTAEVLKESDGWYATMDMPSPIPTARTS